MDAEPQNYLSIIVAKIGDMGLVLDRPFDPAMSYKELGIDSFSTVELIAELEMHFGATIDNDDFSELVTPAATAAYLARRLQSPVDG